MQLKTNILYILCILDIDVLIMFNMHGIYKFKLCEEETVYVTITILLTKITAAQNEFTFILKLEILVIRRWD